MKPSVYDLISQLSRRKASWKPGHYEKNYGGHREEDPRDDSVLRLVEAQQDIGYDPRLKRRYASESPDVDYPFRRHSLSNYSLQDSLDELELRRNASALVPKQTADGPIYERLFRVADPTATAVDAYADQLSRAPISDSDVEAYRLATYSDMLSRLPREEAPLGQGVDAYKGLAASRANVNGLDAYNQRELKSHGRAAGWSPDDSFSPPPYELRQPAAHNALGRLGSGAYDEDPIIDELLRYESEQPGLLSSQMLQAAVRPQGVQNINKLKAAMRKKKRTP